MLLAHTLLGMSSQPERFVLPVKRYRSSYLPLSNSAGGGHKNAVSIDRDYISFMVPDWSLESEALNLGFETRQNTRYGLRLQFLGVTSEKLSSNKDFIDRLMRTAIDESERRKAGVR